jgi:glycerol-3-phosphate cytidylyltransferase-like family protein
MIIAASKLGAKVVVGVNSDEWLKRKKGYAFMPWAERAEMAESIKGVTKAVSFDDSDNSTCDRDWETTTFAPSLEAAMIILA